MLLGHMDLNVKTRRGGAARMYDWGDQAQHSAASYEIIKQAKAMNFWTQWKLIWFQKLND